jgi:hypothetical protein
MPDDSNLPLSQKDMDDLNVIKSKLPPDHPMRGKIDQALSLNAGETQNKPGGPVTNPPTQGPVQGPPEEMPGEEAEASGMQTIAKEHPGLIAGASLANAAPLLAGEAIPTIGRGIVSASRNPYVRGVAAAYGLKYLPDWARPAVEGLGIGSYLRGLRGGGGGGGASSESQPSPTVGEPPVIQAPEPREPMAGEQPGAQYSVPREQLPANVRSGQPGAGEAYRSIGGKVIYTPPSTGGEPIDMAAMRRAGGVSATGKPRMRPRTIGEAP